MSKSTSLDARVEEAREVGEVRARERAQILGRTQHPNAVQNARNEERIREAVRLLRAARELLKQAGAPRATDKVRKALTSAGGALRHAEVADYRQERRAKDA